jgi:hypothetical protein
MAESFDQLSRTAIGGLLERARSGSPDLHAAVDDDVDASDAGTLV